MSGASVDRGAILLDLSADERRVLADLAGSTARALVDPDDPARARLLPDGYRDDPDAAAEFARYTRDDVRRGKLDRIRSLLARLEDPAGRIRLERDDADAWARTLTDVRVALAERAGIREDGDVPEEPETAVVYEWLGALQWRLVESLDRLERRGRDGRRYRSG